MRRAAVRARAGHDPVADFLGYLSIECGLADNTRAAYASDLGAFEKYVRAATVAFPAGVTRRVVTEFLEDSNRRGHATRTLRRRIASLRAFFRYLVLEGELAENPAADVLLPKTWMQLPRSLSTAELGRLLEATGSGSATPLRDRAIAELLYSAGLRVSEALSLEEGDLHFGEGFLRCRGKGSKERLAPMGGPARAAIERYLREERPRLSRARGSARQLFLSVRGRRLGRETLSRIMKRWAAAAGLSSAVTPHTLRHTFATHLLAGGAGLREVQELLGHADIRTTEIYTHVDRTRLKSIHRRCHPRG